MQIEGKTKEKPKPEQPEESIKDSNEPSKLVE